MKPIMLISLIIIIVLVGGFFIFLNIEKTVVEKIVLDPNTKPVLEIENLQIEELNDPFNIVPSEVSINKLIGDWIGLQSISFELTSDVSNSSVSFTETDYYINDEGFVKSGTYSILEDRVQLIDSEFSFIEDVFIVLNGDRLEITFPKYPKTIVYNRKE